jgi:hypothetical protein
MVLGAVDDSFVSVRVASRKEAAHDRVIVLAAMRPIRQPHQMSDGH